MLVVYSPPLDKVYELTVSAISASTFSIYLVEEDKIVLSARLNYEEDAVDRMYGLMKLYDLQYVGEL
jgi:hypothetical protein